MKENSTVIIIFKRWRQGRLAILDLKFGFNMLAGMYSRVYNHAMIASLLDFNKIS